MTENTAETIRSDLFVLWVDSGPIILDEEPQVNPAGVLKGVEPDGGVVWYSDWDKCYRPSVQELKHIMRDVPARQQKLLTINNHDTTTNLE